MQKNLKKKKETGFCKKKKYNFFSFKYFWVEIYLVIFQMYFYVKNVYWYSIQEKVFILQIDEGRFQGEKSYSFTRKMAFIC